MSSDRPEPVPRHPYAPDVSFDGGNLDCGSGLLLLIRQHIDPMRPGQLLEIRSTEPSVEVDLPAWCRLTGNELISWTKSGDQRSYLVCKGSLSDRFIQRSQRQAVPVKIPDRLPEPSVAPPVPELAVMGIGSWPRPRWMLRAIHDHLEGRMSEVEFHEIADDAVRMAVEAQLRAGVDVVTDGEQRRDNYASFVGGILDNCQLIPLTDVLPLVDDPDKFKRELESLDVPASDVRHPVVFGKLGRSRPIAVHELEAVKRLTDRPVKVALPGPYLLTRTMWMDCFVDKAYASREELAEDIVRILREELHFLLEAGAALVQFDEPVLSEVVFTGRKSARSFMCGALSGRGASESELSFARDLLNAVIEGVPRERVAMHICRGNWTPDERAALAGDYGPLVPTLRRIQVGTYFLELCTPRAGEMAILRELPGDARIGIGVVNPKRPEVEKEDEIAARMKRAVELFGKDRVLFTPDCGFATFADNPVASAAVAEAKLRAISRARDRLLQ